MKFLFSALRMRKPKRFGVFSPVLESTGDYLALLHLNSRGAKGTVARVVDCCHASKNAHAEIASLFDEFDWRPHLVAAVALSALSYNRTSMTKLWEVFDAGSWVTPQLAVAAYISDPDFSHLAKERIVARCPLNASRLRSLAPLERHVAAGPTEARQRSAKAAASLVQLVGHIRPTPEWLARERSPDLIAFLSEDVDNAAQLAESWLKKLQSLLALE
jgi:hypothetical protein